MGVADSSLKGSLAIRVIMYWERRWYLSLMNVQYLVVELAVFLIFWFRWKDVVPYTWHPFVISLLFEIIANVLMLKYKSKYFRPWVFYTWMWARGLLSLVFCAEGPAVEYLYNHFMTLVFKAPMFFRREDRLDVFFVFSFVCICCYQVFIQICPESFQIDPMDRLILNIWVYCQVLCGLLFFIRCRACELRNVDLVEEETKREKDKRAKFIRLFSHCSRNTLTGILPIFEHFKQNHFLKFPNLCIRNRFTLSMINAKSTQLVLFNMVGYQKSLTDSITLRRKKFELEDIVSFLDRELGYELSFNHGVPYRFNRQSSYYPGRCVGDKNVILNLLKNMMDYISEKNLTRNEIISSVTFDRSSNEFKFLTSCKTKPKQKEQETCEISSTPTKTIYSKDDLVIFVSQEYVNAMNKTTDQKELKMCIKEDEDKEKRLNLSLNLKLSPVNETEELELGGEDEDDEDDESFRNQYLLKTSQKCRHMFLEEFKESERTEFMKNYQMKILMVEDNEIVRKMMHFQIEQAGQVEHISHCVNGKEAFDKITSTEVEYKPDVILIDFDMPVWNGGKFCQEIGKCGVLEYDDNMKLISRELKNAGGMFSRSFLETKYFSRLERKCPIFLITGGTFKESSIELCQKYGFEDVFFKPVYPPEIKKIIEKALKQKYADVVKQRVVEKLLEQKEKRMEKLKREAEEEEDEELRRRKDDAKNKETNKGVDDSFSSGGSSDESSLSLTKMDRESFKLQRKEEIKKIQKKMKARRKKREEELSSSISSLLFRLIWTETKRNYVFSFEFIFSGIGMLAMMYIFQLTDIFSYLNQSLALTELVNKYDVFAYILISFSRFTNYIFCVLLIIHHSFWERKKDLDFEAKFRANLRKAMDPNDEFSKYVSYVSEIIGRSFCRLGFTYFINPKIHVIFILGLMEYGMTGKSLSEVWGAGAGAMFFATSVILEFYYYYSFFNRLKDGVSPEFSFPYTNFIYGRKPSDTRLLVDVAFFLVFVFTVRKLVWMKINLRKKTDKSIKKLQEEEKLLRFVTCFGSSQIVLPFFSLEFYSKRFFSISPYVILHPNAKNFQSKLELDKITAPDSPMGSGEDNKLMKDFDSISKIGVSEFKDFKRIFYRSLLRFKKDLMNMYIMEYQKNDPRIGSRRVSQKNMPKYPVNPRSGTSRRRKEENYRTEKHYYSNPKSINMEVKYHHLFKLEHQNNELFNIKKMVNFLISEHCQILNDLGDKFYITTSGVIDTQKDPRKNKSRYSSSSTSTKGYSFKDNVYVSFDPYVLEILLTNLLQISIDDYSAYDSSEKRFRHIDEQQDENDETDLIGRKKKKNGEKKAKRIKISWRYDLDKEMFYLNVNYPDNHSTSLLEQQRRFFHPKKKKMKMKKLNRVFGSKGKTEEDKRKEKEIKEGGFLGSPFFKETDDKNQNPFPQLVFFNCFRLAKMLGGSLSFKTINISVDDMECLVSRTRSRRLSGRMKRYRRSSEFEKNKSRIKITMKFPMKKIFVLKYQEKRILYRPEKGSFLDDSDDEEDEDDEDFEDEMMGIVNRQIQKKPKSLFEKKKKKEKKLDLLLRDREEKFFHGYYINESLNNILSMKIVICVRESDLGLERLLKTVLLYCGIESNQISTFYLEKGRGKKKRRRRSSSMFDLDMIADFENQLKKEKEEQEQEEQEEEQEEKEKSLYNVKDIDETLLEGEVFIIDMDLAKNDFKFLKDLQRLKYFQTHQDRMDKNNRYRAPKRKRKKKNVVEEMIDEEEIMLKKSRKTRMKICMTNERFLKYNGSPKKKKKRKGNAFFFDCELDDELDRLQLEEGESFAASDEEYEVRQEIQTNFDCLRVMKPLRPFDFLRCVDYYFQFLKK